MGKCGNCGAPFTQSPGAKFGVCQYCGRQYIFKVVIPDTRRKRRLTHQLTFTSIKKEKIMATIREWEENGWTFVEMREEKPAGHSIGRFGIKTIVDLEKEEFIVEKAKS